MEKTLFLDLIERHYGTQLSRFQLQYFFSSSRYVAASSPRRGGKSFIAQLDCLYTCTTPNKQVLIILPGEMSLKTTKESITTMVQALNGYIRIDHVYENKIRFNNNSAIYLLTNSNSLDNCRGLKINKAVIEEPDYVKDIESLRNVLECCMISSEDAQLKLIGTHSASKHNLKSYMLSPYFEKITATPNSIYSPMNREALNEMRSALGDSARFRLEFLNEVSPSLWGNTD